MYRVTTPTHTFTLPMSTSSLKEIQVTYLQGEVSLIKHYQDGIMPSGMSLDDDKVIIQLTQEETKLFAANKNISTQVRVLTNDNEAFASQLFIVEVDEVLSEDVLADA